MVPNEQQVGSDFVPLEFMALDQYDNVSLPIHLCSSTSSDLLVSQEEKEIFFELKIYEKQDILEHNLIGTLHHRKIP